MSVMLAPPSQQPEQCIVRSTKGLSTAALSEVQCLLGCEGRVGESASHEALAINGSATWPWSGPHDVVHQRGDDQQFLLIKLPRCALLPTTGRLQRSPTCQQDPYYANSVHCLSTTSSAWFDSFPTKDLPPTQFQRTS